MKPNEPPADGDPEAASPFPPVFRWDAGTQDAPTQVMAPIGRDPASPSYQQSSTEAQDLFQPVDPGHGTHPNQANESLAAPPWADSDLSPIAEQQSAWLRQGPEVFQTPATGSRSKQIIGIAVLAVVVLGLVGATVAYFLTTGPGRTGNRNSPRHSRPQPPVTCHPRRLRCRRRWTQRTPWSTHLDSFAAVVACLICLRCWRKPLLRWRPPS